MGKPRLFGADYSAYVRIVQLTLAAKGVDYDLVPVDIFSADGVPAWYREHHPFGRIPAFEHDGFRLFEATAITRYVDEAFAGPALQPADVKQRATMNQIIGLLDAYAYRAMVWDVYVERVSKPKDGKVSDEALIAAGLEKSKTCLATLTKLKAPGDWLLGDAADARRSACRADVRLFREGAGGPRLARRPSRIVALVGACGEAAWTCGVPTGGLIGAQWRSQQLSSRDALTIARIVRVNHAGEFGAIRIYSAQILVARWLCPDCAARADRNARP